MNKDSLIEVKAGLQSGLSIALGYLPVAMAFGILAKASGIELGQCVGFSAIVFAGASQFVALEMLNTSAGVFSIIFTVFLFNFRHFIMGASLSTKLNRNCLRWRPLIAFWMTDETYSVAYLKQETVGIYFYLPMAAIAYLSFSAGSLLGFQLGSVLPVALNQSMSIALYAMFLAILTPEFKKSFKPIGIVATAGILNVFVQSMSFIPQGWHIIIVIVLTVAIWNVIDKETLTNEVSNYE